MGMDDKAKHRGERVKGRAKETAGTAADDPQLEQEGREEQAKASAKSAGEKAKDAAKDAGDALKR